MYPTLIFDFDSTLIPYEGLDELARIVFETVSDKGELISRFQEITNFGMEGKYTFERSLSERLNLLSCSQSIIPPLANFLKQSVLKSTQDFFHTELASYESIYIVSGGFKELILPTTQSLGISDTHVFANTFKWDLAGNLKGCDFSNPLSKAEGKVTSIKNLKLEGEVWMIGDGFSDCQVKESGYAHKFIAYTEFVKRNTVIERADVIANSMEDIKRLLCNHPTT
ncbi:haloacid dehalogenase-like hydrolase [Candidatus Dojkabacteria bacterium]|uniref:phosphoserine phosphatase n=1 Tax=Candidatus Dojkabacteria bacterium TaxID=2099670 RepID=A0A955L9Y0_9BACT|nr:haloacid dehalogenase-like hydrolase [Candidatus Dojkabacteria bacterium]